MVLGLTHCLQFELILEYYLAVRAHPCLFFFPNLVHTSSKHQMIVFYLLFGTDARGRDVTALLNYLSLVPVRVQYFPQFATQIN